VSKVTLQELMKAIDTLSYDELRQLRRYIDEHEQLTHPYRDSTPEERIQRLDAVAAALREGLTEEQWLEMTAAMDEESAYLLRSPANARRLLSALNRALRRES
jgi:hypothetical protein